MSSHICNHSFPSMYTYLTQTSTTLLQPKPRSLSTTYPHYTTLHQHQTKTPPSDCQTDCIAFCHWLTFQKLAAITPATSSSTPEQTDSVPGDHLAKLKRSLIPGRRPDLPPLRFRSRCGLSVERCSILRLQDSRIPAPRPVRKGAGKLAAWGGRPSLAATTIEAMWQSSVGNGRKLERKGTGPKPGSGCSAAFQFFHYLRVGPTVALLFIKVFLLSVNIRKSWNHSWGPDPFNFWPILALIMWIAGASLFTYSQSQDSWYIV